MGTHPIFESLSWVQPIHFIIFAAVLCVITVSVALIYRSLALKHYTYGLIEGEKSAGLPATEIPDGVYVVYGFDGRVLFLVDKVNKFHTRLFCPRQGFPDNQEIKTGTYLIVRDNKISAFN